MVLKNPVKKSSHRSEDTESKKLPKRKLYIVLMKVMISTVD